MLNQIELVAADDHSLAAYTALPEGAPKGGVVILQEIFGVTDHIRRVADGFAESGYAVIAPALFDRARRGVELDYSDIPTGKSLVEQIPPADSLKDIAAAVEWARGYGRVAAVGYCWGGTLAYLAAGALPVDAAVSYYGGMIARLLDRKPVVPVLYHFGQSDAFIPASDTDAIRKAAGDDEVHIYEGAGHGFNCDQRPDYRPAAAALARERTLEFLHRNIG